MNDAKTQVPANDLGSSDARRSNLKTFRSLLLGDTGGGNQGDAQRILNGTPPHVLMAFATLDYYARQIHSRVTGKTDGPCAFLYGVQNEVRMRPRILRIALRQSPPYDTIVIKVDPRVSDPKGWFQQIEEGRREWKSMSLAVLPAGIPAEDLKYIVEQLIHAVEYATGSTSTLDPSKVIALTSSSIDSIEVCQPIDTSSDTSTNEVAPGSDEDYTDRAPEDDADNETDSGDVIAEDAATIRWRDDSHTVHEFCRRYGRGRIDLRPDFQRQYVWTPVIARRFIESLFLGLPVPTIYMAETSDNQLQVIDGQQRLQTIVNFHENKLSLSRVSVKSLLPLEGLRFKDLPQGLQDRFDDYRLSVVVLEKSCSPDLKFDMFERLNQGSVKLNKQELRNCIYRGPYNKLLSRLADSSAFIEACGWKDSQRRMKGEEMVLRFFAFHFRNVASIKTYNGALNEEMRANQFLPLDEQARRERVFKDALALCVQVFGSNPFRTWIGGKSDGDPTGRWEDRLNSVVFEVLMTSFATYDKPKVVENADAIREEFINLLSTDQFMVDALTLGTNSREKMQYRHDTWRAALRSLLESTEREPRCFQLSFKRELWQRDPTCRICAQAIHSLEDAAVDHVTHYWRGGKTVPSNARLVHRFCNSRRGGRD